ncbi:unnamed protein product [Blepharisma stoltei]|uniref:Uncharacterized protein n=1 Tax=Blepharisma stoltei TaxID=1481888 RepID=A0AAU9ID21_9CILI|nr:unnamed protein product [Blepharisma stoltei]
MPPRGKKIDPAVQAQQFEDWQKTEEVANWNVLCQIKLTFAKLISTTSPDITDDKFAFLEGLHKQVDLMKVPHKSHSYEQLHLRTAFFPQVGLDYILKVDGLEFNLELNKECVDKARECRIAFVAVVDSLDTIKTAEATTYVQTRKDFIKKLTVFEKAYMVHLKIGHNYLYDSVLAVILSPMINAIDANMNLYYLENRAHEKRKWFKKSAPAFRLKACKIKFAEAMTELIKRLKEHGPLEKIPNILKSLSKLEINTASHEVLKYFVSPVKAAWRKLRSEMKILYKAGVNHYRQPIKKNKDLVRALKNMIDAESIAEDLLGDALKMDQLEFIYDVIMHVRRSSMEQALFEGDSGVIKDIIPQLATFKALQQMYQVREDIEKKQKEKREVGLELEAVKQDKDNSFFVWSQDKEVRYEGIKRLWVWDGYINEEDKPMWDHASDLVSQLNLMVQEDIMDYIISSRAPKKPGQGQRPTESRPPFVWNTQLMNNRYVDIEPPLYQEEEAKQEVQTGVKKIREYTKPMDCYRDGRVEEILEIIEKLAFGLKVTQGAIWDQLLEKVITAMKNETPTSGDEDISFEKDPEEGEEGREEEMKEEIRYED